MTQSDFNTKYGRLAMPKPFASETGAALATIQNEPDQTNLVNFPYGFPSNYSAPRSNNGKYVTRGEMNAIGNLASRNDFYRACGGLNTFNPALSALIGGYPKDAVLQFVVDGQLYFVRSLVDNNTTNFLTAGVDFTHWAYCNMAAPETQGEIAVGSVSGLNMTPTCGVVGTTQVVLDNYYQSVCEFIAPKTGFIGIRNIFNGVSMGTNSRTQSDYQCYLGYGVCVKNLTANNESFASYTTPEIGTWTGGTFNNWRNIAAMGRIVYSANNVDTGMPTGTYAVNAGDQCVVGFITAAYSATYNQASGVATVLCNKCENTKFDIVVF